MTRLENFPNSAEQKAQETLERMAIALAEAKAAVEPRDSKKTFYEVFPEPGERRTDTEFQLDGEREKQFREAMAKLGIGRESNVTASELGLASGYLAVVEGGLAHKIAAELNAVLSDETVRPAFIIISATPDRKIPPAETDKAQERQFAAKILGKELSEISDTEYDVAVQVAERLPGFQKQEGGVFFGSGFTGDGEIIESRTKQFESVGSIIEEGKQPISVIMMRIDRKQLEGGRYEQMGARKILKAVDGTMRLVGNNGDIGFVTSSTYQPSRETDAASAMLEIGRGGNFRNIGVITYGMQELANVKGTSTPLPPDLGQLAGEAYKATQQVEVLRELIKQNTPGQET